MIDNVRRKLVEQTISNLKGLEFSRHLDFISGMAEAKHLRQEGRLEKAEMTTYCAIRNKVLECQYYKKHKYLTELFNT